MDYKDILTRMKLEGSPIPDRRPSFSFPNAKEELRMALETIGNAMNEKIIWLPEYDKVAEWLSNTNGKGLFLYGSCGRGKSLLIRYAIPMIFRLKSNLIFTVVDCSTPIEDLDSILRKRMVSLDDIGIEGTTKVYGTQRNGVTEIISRFHERREGVLLISSNLGADELKGKYDERILDRIKYLCVRIPFNGQSLRR